MDYALSLKRFEEALGNQFEVLPGRKHCKKATLISRNEVNGHKPAKLFTPDKRFGGVGQLKAF